jgi:hypothetical protein
MFTIKENYRLIMWGIPVVTILHNMEEALLLSSYLEEYNELMPGFAAGIVGTVTLESLLFVLVLSSLLPVIFVWQSNLEENPNISEILLYCFAFAMMVNLIPHTAITISAGSYSPGLASSFLLVLPATLFLFISVIRNSRLTSGQWITVVIGGLLIHGPGLLAAIAVGNAIWG